MFEIREWRGKQKVVVKHGIANLGMAFIEKKRFEQENPKRIYSIFRSREGRKKDDYYA